MVSPTNGQVCFTAERVARTRPKTYRAVVRPLAEPDAKIEHIAPRHSVSSHTVRAIREREAGVAENAAQAIRRAGEADRESRALAESKEILPKRETFSGPRSPMDLQTVKELPKST